MAKAYMSDQDKRMREGHLFAIEGSAQAVREAERILADTQPAQPFRLLGAPLKDFWTLIPASELGKGGAYQVALAESLAAFVAEPSL